MSVAGVELYIVRHAHAGHASRWAGDDARRPLTPKGHVQAERLARHLAALRPDLDVIIASPRIRARETADAIATALGQDVRVEDRLGGGLTVRTLEEVLDDAGNPARAMIVGHDPDLSEIVAELVGATSIPMRKGSLARIDAARPLRSGAAILRWLLPPDALSAEPA